MAASYRCAIARLRRRRYLDHPPPQPLAVGWCPSRLASSTRLPAVSCLPWLPPGATEVPSMPPGRYQRDLGATRPLNAPTPGPLPHRCQTFHDMSLYKGSREGGTVGGAGTRRPNVSGKDPPVPLHAGRQAAQQCYTPCVAGAAPADPLAALVNDWLSVKGCKRAYNNACYPAEEPRARRKRLQKEQSSKHARRARRRRCLRRCCGSAPTTSCPLLETVINHAHTCTDHLVATRSALASDLFASSLLAGTPQPAAPHLSYVMRMLACLCMLFTRRQHAT